MIARSIDAGAVQQSELLKLAITLQKIDRILLIDGVCRIQQPFVRVKSDHRTVLLLACPHRCDPFELRIRFIDSGSVLLIARKDIVASCTLWNDVVNMANLPGRKRENPFHPAALMQAV